MTSAVASIGVSYSGTDLQDADLGVFLEIVSGMAADGLDVRGVDVVVPGLTGRIARGRRLDTRRIELRGHVMGQGSTQDDRQADYRDSMDALAALFDPSASPDSLVLTMEDSSTRTIEARPLPGMMVEVVVPSEFAYVSIVLESVSPTWVPGGS